MCSAHDETQSNGNSLTQKSQAVEKSMAKETAPRITSSKNMTMHE